VAATCNWLRTASMTRLREMCPDWAKQTGSHYLEHGAFLSTLCCPRFSTDSSLLRVSCTLKGLIAGCKLFFSAGPRWRGQQAPIHNKINMLPEMDCSPEIPALRLTVKFSNNQAAKIPGNLLHKICSRPSANNSAGTQMTFIHAIPGFPAVTPHY
jgi:hypothetical protein